MRAIVLGCIFGLASTATVTAAGEPPDPGGSRFFSRLHLGWIGTRDELNDDRYGPTESRDGTRLGLRNGWEFRRTGAPLAVVLSVDVTWERRTMVGVLDNRPVVNPIAPVGSVLLGPVIYWSDEMQAARADWERLRPAYEMQARRRSRHHLSTFDGDFGLGLRTFLLPDEALVLELRAFFGLSEGRLGGASYDGTQAGVSLGASYEAVPGARVGLEVGYGWRKGDVDEYDADYRGRALEVSLGVEVAF